MSRFYLCALIVFASAAAAAQAQDWFSLAAVSNTVGLNANRLCSANNSQGDIGCASYAPSLTTAGDVSVTGNLSANQFIGNGAGLTNLNPAAITGLLTDAITSGTTTMRVNSASSFISLTTGGVTWAYLGNAASFMPNVSATRMEVSATLNLRPQSVTTIVGSAGGGAGSSASSSLISSGTTSVATFTGTNSISLSTAGTTRMVVTSAGRVGIGTNIPLTTLEVNGTVSAAALVVNGAAVGGESTLLSGGIHNENECTTAGGVVYRNNEFKFCQFSSGCPSGWLQFKRWTATTSNSCSTSGGCSCSPAWACTPKSCTSGSHAFADTPPESCTYGSYSGSNCGLVAYACQSTVTSYGCY